MRVCAQVEKKFRLEGIEREQKGGGKAKVAHLQFGLDPLFTKRGLERLRDEESERGLAHSLSDFFSLIFAGVDQVGK